MLIVACVPIFDLALWDPRSQRSDYVRCQMLTDGVSSHTTVMLNFERQRLGSLTVIAIINFGNRKLVTLGWILFDTELSRLYDCFNFDCFDQLCSSCTLGATIVFASWVSVFICETEYVGITSIEFNSLISRLRKSFRWNSVLVRLSNQKRRWFVNKGWAKRQD